jgi:hypothetical protein
MQAKYVFAIQDSVDLIVNHKSPPFQQPPHLPLRTLLVITMLKQLWKQDHLWNERIGSYSCMMKFVAYFVARDKTTST